MTDDAENISNSMLFVGTLIHSTEYIFHVPEEPAVGQTVRRMAANTGRE